MQVKPIADQMFDIGRCVIMRYVERDGEGAVVSTDWDGTTNFFEHLEHIGTTEGPVDPESNPDYSDLKIEVTGPAILKRYLSGENPSFELGVFPNPENMKVFSPTGRASAGQSLRQRVRTHSIWVVAEEVFIKEIDGVNQYTTVSYEGGGVFLKDGDPMSDDDLDRIDVSLIIWKASFDRLMPRHDHADGGKSLKTVPVAVQQDFRRPEGCQLYLAMSEIEDFGEFTLEGDES